MCQLWRALESLDDIATSHLSWQLWLGDSFSNHRDWLQPTGPLAAALPVAGRPYEWLEVCEVTEGVFEGYNVKTEEFVPVERGDIVCYEFNFRKLADELAGLVGFDVAFEKLGGPPYRYRLGHFGNPLGSGFSFYLAKANSPRRLESCIDALLAETPRPFGLFLASNRMLSSRAEAVLDARGCLTIPLEQTLVHNAEEGWSLSSWASQQLVQFRDSLLPPTKPVAGRFPTPPGSRWSEVSLRFLSSDRVAVSIRDQHQVLTYAQLGLVDSRNGRPSKQWELLRQFANTHGLMTWNSPGACRQNRKRRELLSKSLQNFFDIAGEPIELTDDRKGWCCVLKLQPEGWEQAFGSADAPDQQHDQW